MDAAKIVIRKMQSNRKPKVIDFLGKAFVRLRGEVLEHLLEQN
jgi:hypothetical protein